MYRFFIEDGYIKDQDIYIRGDSFNHIKNSLRKKIGDKIEVNFEGNLFLCQIEDFLKDSIRAKILKEKGSENESNLSIHFCQSIPKNDKPESIFQRACELGVVEIIPFISNRTIVKFNDKSKKNKKERFERVIRSSSQQAKRDIIPNVSDILEFDDLLKHLEGKQVLLAYENGGLNLKDAFKEVNVDRDIYIIIGPEGGFEEYEVEEVKKIGGQIVSLGNRILRVETAGLSLVSSLQYELGDMG